MVSVKGGKNIGPSIVRDLPGTVETQRAQMGVPTTMVEPPRGVIDAANHGHVYTSDSQLSEFRALIQASCLGTGTILGHLSSLLSSAADRAAASLTLAITSF